MLVFILKNLGYIFRKSVIHNILTKYKFLSKYKQATKLDFNILIFFKLFFISEVITKKNRLYFEKKANDYEKKYTLSEDWFSFNIPIWDHVINKEFDKISKLKFLKIGVFEGRSVIHICESYKNFEITCVDPFQRYDEIDDFVKKQDMEKTFEIFKENISQFKDRVEYYKLTSEDFFNKNNSYFNIIYIDGSHYYLDVMQDFQNSIRVLNKGGIIILDDFLWGYYKKIDENPIHGILPVLKNEKNLKIISASWQLIVKKT